MRLCYTPLYMADAAKKILLAEDDEFLSSLLKNRLEREHFTVTAVKNGNDILPAIKESRPDLLLLDIILPGKLGFEVLEEIKSDAKLAKVPFMVISNLGQDSDIARAKELGAAEYFVKARVMIDDVVAKIITFLK